MGRLIIDGKRVYEVDELCLKRKKNMDQTNESGSKGDKEKKNKK